jgi:predicted SAM-dependent methyltransferase
MSTTAHPDSDLHTSVPPPDTTHEQRRYVLTSDAVVRCGGGRLRLHAGLTARVIGLDTGDLSLLAGLARPTTVAALVARSGRDVAHVEERLARFISLGTVVETPPPREAEDQARRREIADGWRRLRLLAAAVHELGGDIAAFGAYGYQHMRADSGIGLSERLDALLHGIEGLLGECRRQRQPFLDNQLARLGLSRTSTGLWLHIGAGQHRIPSWINVDADGADLSLNLRWGLPFADGSVARIFLCHVLEHLYHPAETQAFVKELRRVLEPDGVVRAVVPDIEQYIRAYCAQDHEFFERRRAHWPWWSPHRTDLESFLAYAGANAHPAAFLSGHKYGFDFETLAALLKAGGFTHVTRSGFMDSRFPELRLDDRSLVAGVTHASGTYSLFVEAAP